MRRTMLATAAIAATFGLAACGTSSTDHSTGHSGGHSSSQTTTATTGDHNAADAMFAQMMVPHHQSAVVMAALAPTRASNPRVKALAARIGNAQQPEITQMTGWLTSWNVPAGDGHMGHSMPGAMSESDMQALTAAKGPAFDRQFLTMMIPHHEGALEMARTEQADGQFAPAKTLAGNIVTSQTAEIDEMKKLLETV